MLKYDDNFSWETRILKRVASENKATVDSKNQRVRKIDSIREKVTGKRERDNTEKKYIISKLVYTDYDKIVSLEQVNDKRVRIVVSRGNLHHHLNKLKNKLIRFWGMEFQFHDFKVIDDWIELYCDYQSDWMPIRIPTTCINQFLTTVSPRGIFVFTIPHNSTK